MRRSSKLWLLLGFIRVFSFSSHAMESEADTGIDSRHMFGRAPCTNFGEDLRQLPPVFGGHFAQSEYGMEAPPISTFLAFEAPVAYQASQVSAWMAYYFGEDRDPSPFAEAAQDASVRLLERVVRYMRAANGEALHKLFYEPDVTQWQTLYQQVTGGRMFSTLDLIGLLDQTRTKILSRYAVLGRTAYAQDAYFSVHSLLDLALEKIFGGCWGISDEKLPDDTINGLKGVYGRVVSGLFRMAGSRLVGELADSLQEKKRQPLRSAYERSHLEALQECAAAVLYEGNSSRGYSGFEHEFLTDFNQQIDASLSLPSFQQTMRHARYRDPFDGIGMDDNDIISILSFRDSKFGKERVVYLRDDSDQERALKVAMLPMTHDYDGVLYAWGEEKLTKSQAKDVLIALSNDKRWNVVEKNNYLQKLLDLLPAADAEVSAVITRIVSKLDPTTQADQVIETVRDIATRRSGFGGCGEGEAKKLCLMPQNQEILLNLYEQALSNLEPNPNRRISSWISLRGYSESNFNPIKLALKTLTACEHIQDEKHEEDDEEDRYTFSAAQSISEVLGRILVGNKGLNDNEQETLVTALRQSLACNTSVQTRGDSYRVWRDLLSFSTREEQPVIASATLRAQVMAQFIESFEATAKKPEMVDRLDRELQRLRYGLLADVREQFLGVLEDKQRFQEVDTAVKEQWAQILREDDPWGARMLLGDDTKGDA